MAAPGPRTVGLGPYKFSAIAFPTQASTSSAAVGSILGGLGGRFFPGYGDVFHVTGHGNMCVGVKLDR
jgi:hypothetical protein